MRIPALALSALSSPEDQARALGAGFDRYEIKLNRGSLAEVMAELMRMCRDNGVKPEFEVFGLGELWMLRDLADDRPVESYQRSSGKVAAVRAYTALRS